MNAEIPLVIEFVPGSHLFRETAPEAPQEPQVQDAFVQIPGGSEFALPDDQIVLNEEQGGFARVGFGGMSFEGLQDGRLVFWRVKDLVDEDLLPPGREIKVTLPPEAVSSVYMHGEAVWPRHV